MMCFQCRRRIPEWVQNRLAGPIRADVEGHLSTCASCKIRLGEEQALRGRFTSLKQSNSPVDWADFDARLRNRIQRTALGEPARSPVKTFFPIWAPALAGGLLIVVFWAHRKPLTSPVRSSPAFRLASDQQQKTAEQAFKEMADLFPNRINWISFVDGKMDFSVSAESLAGESIGKTVVVTAPRPGALFEPRFFLRAGQDVTVKTQWGDTGEVSLRLSLSKDGERVHLLFRVSSALDGASLEGTAGRISSEPQELGTLRWDGSPVAVQVRWAPDFSNAGLVPRGKTKL
jgi:hypothetical protein